MPIQIQLLIKITLSEKFSKNQIILFDLLGKNYPVKLMNNFNSSTSLDISSLSRGLYFRENYK